MSGSGAVTYTWLPGGQVGQTVNIFPQPSSNTTYTLVGTDANGCVNFDAIYIPVHPLPSISAGGTSPVCTGDNVCLNANGSVIMYSWAGPCGYTSANQNDCFIIASGCGGTYNVAGTDINGCLNVASVIIVVAEPTLVVTPNPSPTCIGLTTTLSASGGLSYTWNPGGQTGTSIVVTPTANLIYTVSIDNGTCTAAKNYSEAVGPCTSTGKNETWALSLSIFPNPSSGMIYFKTDDAEKSAKIILQDVAGIAVRSETILFKNGMDVKELAGGIYFCSIDIGGQVQRIKFVKE